MAAKPGSTPDFGALRELFKPHIESFDYMIDTGLETMLSHIKPVEIFDSSTSTKLRDILFLVYEPAKDRFSKTIRAPLYPFECRQAGISYTGKFMMDVCFQYNDSKNVIRHHVSFGELPIMLQSKKCNLRGADHKKLVSFKEEASEMGGYFILNGLERVIRLLILPKRNYPMSMVRNSFSDRREGYTDKAVVIRCVRADQSSVTLKLYYLRNGSARLGFWMRGREYLLPVGIVLKALIDTTDREIYVNLTSCYNEKYGKGKGTVGTHLVGERAKIILDEVRDLSLFTRLQCLEYIGENFRPIMFGLENDSYPVVADAVLTDYVFVHLENNFDKFNLLICAAAPFPRPCIMWDACPPLGWPFIFMLQKLFSLIDQTSVPDNPDSLQNQEVLLPGHLITLYLKEKLEDWLQKGKRLVQDEIKQTSKNFDIGNTDQVKSLFEKNPPRHVGSTIENMLKTGRLNTQTGLDLQQFVLDFILLVKP
ncbi:DNA-directed RNA polymerase I subunit RPA2 [Stylosanthes scabra]|uniref:DNA-directed RNA polymerase n=1 Tax=Stylosanthes scabra TaxID=79078 RepID=A0ABU6VJI7_9FABA|nr:DNA-directed RNA polymerase I subunit RPA2 [Stylosanthes scabra]